MIINVPEATAGELVPITIWHVVAGSFVGCLAAIFLVLFLRAVALGLTSILTDSGPKRRKQKFN